MRGRAAAAGFSLLELMITLAVLGIVMMVGLPNVSAWIQNTQLKTAAESVVSGLQLTRAEALRRNVSVRFSLVDSVANGCALSVTGTSWVVSVSDPTGACGADPSDVAPQIVQKKSGAEGTPNATLAGVGGTTALFNGLGRLVGVGNLTQVNVSNPTGGACMSAGGPMRCLAIMIGNGGQVRMCDPSVADAADPRVCGADFVPF